VVSSRPGVGASAPVLEQSLARGATATGERRSGVAMLIRWLKRGAAVLLVALVVLLGARAWDVQRGPPLELWHTHVPHELKAKEIARSDWAHYLAAENAAIDEVRSEVTRKLEPDAQTLSNRYFEGSPVWPGRFVQDWNRSFILDPAGAPMGAVVLLHGLTDSPYSLRHVALRYRDRGFVVVAIRLPGHGTVPAGLTRTEWEDWSEATRLAVREARRRAGSPAPLHLVGYSNGGALAMKYALDTLSEPALARPDRLVLISPMIGITGFARFAGAAGWPAVFPAFAKATWLGVVPEFNPFKYNSFPVNAARQSSLLTREVQQRIAGAVASGRLAELPPVLTFQSVVDFTVSTRAVVTELYAHLPANSSELVLFDLNRNSRFGPLLREQSEAVVARLLPEAPRRFTATIVTNADAGSEQMVARVTRAGATAEDVRPLGLAYPRDVFSLSHIALPFPVGDALYGLEPDGTDDFGVNLGAMAVRGERGALLVSFDLLGRVSSNPFYPYLQQRIDAGIAVGATATR
jgi:alpha-beta hydrolase superfamily lysophospholipase